MAALWADYAVLVSKSLFWRSTVICPRALARRFQPVIRSLQGLFGGVVWPLQGVSLRTLGRFIRGCLAAGATAAPPPWRWAGLECELRTMACEFLVCGVGLGLLG